MFDRRSDYLRLTLLLAIAFVFVADLHGKTVEGTVTGSVYDRSGEAIMPAVEAVIKDGPMVQKAISDQNGSYKFHLPPGNYEISVTGNNLYPLRRSAIRIASGQSITINLYPSFRVRSQALEVTDRGVADKYSYWPESKYELVTTASGENCLIEFKERRTRRGAKEYTGSGFEQVKLTIGLLTVLATCIHVDSFGRIRAIGEVLIDDGRKRTRTDEYNL